MFFFFANSILKPCIKCQPWIFHEIQTWTYIYLICKTVSNLCEFIFHFANLAGNGWSGKAHMNTRTVSLLSHGISGYGLAGIGWSGGGTHEHKNSVLTFPRYKWVWLLSQSAASQNNWWSRGFSEIPALCWWLLHFPSLPWGENNKA